MIEGRRMKEGRGKNNGNLSEKGRRGKGERV